MEIIKENWVYITSVAAGFLATLKLLFFIRYKRSHEDLRIASCQTSIDVYDDLVVQMHVINNGNIIAAIRSVDILILDYHSIWASLDKFRPYYGLSESPTVYEHRSKMNLPDKKGEHVKVSVMHQVQPKSGEVLALSFHIKSIEGVIARTWILRVEIFTQSSSVTAEPFEFRLGHDVNFSKFKKTTDGRQIKVNYPTRRGGGLG